MGDYMRSVTSTGIKPTALWSNLLSQFGRKTVINLAVMGSITTKVNNFFFASCDFSFPY